MPWLPPPVKLPGDVLTAAEINVIGDDLNACAAGKFTTKGDLFVGTGSHAGMRLGVNALNGQTLVSDSGEASGLKWQSQFTAILTRASNKSISNNTVTQIDFTATNGVAGGDSETYDAFNLHDNSSNQTRITVNRKGIYLIGGYAAFAANTTGIRYVAISINGSQVVVNSPSGTLQSAVVSLPVQTLAVLASSNYIELDVYQNSGGNLNCTVATLWAIWLHDMGM